MLELTSSFFKSLELYLLLVEVLRQILLFLALRWICCRGGAAEVERLNDDDLGRHHWFHDLNFLALFGDFWVIDRSAAVDALDGHGNLARGLIHVVRHSDIERLFLHVRIEWLQFEFLFVDGTRRHFLISLIQLHLNRWYDGRLLGSSRGHRLSLCRLRSHNLIRLDFLVLF